MTRSEDYRAALLDALHHLGDPLVLQESALIAMLGLKSSPDPAAALDQALTSAIASLRPAGPPDVHSVTHRRYQVLHGRYIEHLTQRVVAGRLGLGERQLRRVQDDAVSWLGRFLALEFDLSADDQPVEMAGALQSAGGARADINREMQWLLETSREQTADIATAVQSALELAAPLAEGRRISLGINCDSDCPSAVMPDTVLRQVLLNLLCGMVAALPEGSSIAITALYDQDRAHATLTASPTDPRQSYLHDMGGDEIEMARRLVELFGGDLRLTEGDGVVMAAVILPAVQRQVTVLAIEDNRDTVRMWRRFLQRTAFRLVDVSDASEAVTRVGELQPDVVLLDIMLGGMDGWELLRELRADPQTSQVPVVICSVLPQERLALSLGAAGFIRKPVTGREFRAALARQTSGASQ